MSRNALTTVLAVVAAFGVGLTWSWFTTGAPGGVAVVDLDEVARRLGREDEMAQSIRSQGERLNQQLSAAQQQAVRQLEAMRASLGDEPTADEAQEFVRTQRSAQIQFNELRQQAQARLGQHRQQLVGQFRKDAKPIAAKIAKSKGLTTVVTRNDSVVFSFDDTVDITGEVIAQMSAELPARSAPKPATEQEQQSRPAEAVQQTAENSGPETR